MTRYVSVDSKDIGQYTCIFDTTGEAGLPLNDVDTTCPVLQARWQTEKQPSTKNMAQTPVGAVLVLHIVPKPPVLPTAESRNITEQVTEPQKRIAIEDGVIAGRVTVHPIADSGKEESQATFQVPAVGTAGDVICMALSIHFLVLGTANGTILYYHCQEKALLNKFKHADGPILQIFPQPSGTRSALKALLHVHCWSALTKVTVNLGCFREHLH